METKPTPSTPTSPPSPPSPKTTPTIAFSPAPSPSERRERLDSETGPGFVDVGGFGVAGGIYGTPTRSHSCSSVLSRPIRPNNVFDDIASLMEDMNKKMNLAGHEAELDMFVLFLEGLRDQKNCEKEKAENHLKIIEQDLETLQELRGNIPDPCTSRKRDRLQRNTSEQLHRTSNSNLAEDEHAVLKRSVEDRAAKVFPLNPRDKKDCDFQSKKRKIVENFEELQDAYFRTKCVAPQKTREQVTQKAIDAFLSTHLHPCVKMKEIKTVAVLKHNHQNPQMNNKVRCMGFNYTDEVLAVSGSSKKLELFHTSDIPYHEGMGGEGGCDGAGAGGKTWSSRMLECGGVVVGMSWNPRGKTQLCTSDLGGKILLWDVEACSSLTEWNHHKKSCWSLHFSNLTPNLFASASDDCTVRLWDLGEENPTLTIPAPSSVLSVKWNPDIEYQLAFGCGDNKVYFYDVRKPGNPLSVTSPHRRPISAIDWLCYGRLVTQSNDETIKVWSVNNGVLNTEEPIRTFKGHSQFSNLIGLACRNGYIATGSEDNSVYVYYESLSKPAFVETFNCGLPCEDEKSFVSAVAWRSTGQALVAGNDRGIIKILSVDSS